MSSTQKGTATVAVCHEYLLGLLLASDGRVLPDSDPIRTEPGCGAQCQREHTMRWACPTHGSKITVRWLEDHGAPTGGEAQAGLGAKTLPNRGGVLLKPLAALDDDGALDQARHALREARRIAHAWARVNEDARGVLSECDTVGDYLDGVAAVLSELREARDTSGELRAQPHASHNARGGES